LAPHDTAGYATHVLCEATYVRALPDGWGFEEGASFLCTALTAWYGLVKLGALSQNQTVLVHSAAGGVGLSSLEIVAAHGARAIATIGSPAKAQMLQDRMNLPPHRILVRPPTAQEFARQLDTCLEAIHVQEEQSGDTHRPAAAPEGLDIVMDSVQGPYFQPAYDKLARGGRLVVFGAASMTPAGDRPNWLKLAWHWLRRPTVSENARCGGWRME
jgi:NADPH:quinone reductase-like Zn-dependent oxidoreductase